MRHSHLFITLWWDQRRTNSVSILSLRAALTAGFAWFSKCCLKACAHVRLSQHHAKVSVASILTRPCSSRSCCAKLFGGAWVHIRYTSVYCCMLSALEKASPLKSLFKSLLSLSICCRNRVRPSSNEIAIVAAQRGGYTQHTAWLSADAIHLLAATCTSAARRTERLLPSNPHKIAL